LPIVDRRDDAWIGGTSDVPAGGVVFTNTAIID
jgi:hypothetical protein